MGTAKSFSLAPVLRGEGTGNKATGSRQSFLPHTIEQQHIAMVRLEPGGESRTLTRPVRRGGRRHRYVARFTAPPATPKAAAATQENHYLKCYIQG